MHNKHFLQSDSWQNIKWTTKPISYIHWSIHSRSINNFWKIKYLSKDFHCNYLKHVRLLLVILNTEQILLAQLNISEHKLSISWMIYGSAYWVRLGAIETGSALHCLDLNSMYLIFLVSNIWAQQRMIFRVKEDKIPGEGSSLYENLP